MFSLFRRRKKSATIARERLKIAITSDRAGHEIPFIEDLKRDIINVIKKYKGVSNIEIRKIDNQKSEAISIEVELDGKSF